LLSIKNEGLLKVTGSDVRNRSVNISEIVRDSATDKWITIRKLYVDCQITSITMTLYNLVCNCLTAKLTSPVDAQSVSDSWLSCLITHTFWPRHRLRVTE